MSNLKRFFIKFGAILCVVALIIGILNHQYVNGYYYRDVYGEVEKFQDVPYHITFANFGTSHGLATFRYAPEETSCFNFALSGEDIYHDFQTLRQFSDHLEKGCLVTVPVDYFSFCLSTEEPSQKRYYTYLDKKYLRDFSVETLINSKYIPVLRSIEYLFKDLIGDQEINVENFMDDPVMEEDESADGQERNGETALDEQQETVDTDWKQELKQHAVTRAESWRSGRMVLGGKYKEENTALLIKMINACKGYGFAYHSGVFRFDRRFFRRRIAELLFFVC